MDVVRLADLVGVNSLIEDKTIENTELVGPAVVGFVGANQLDNVTFEGTDPTTLFLEVPDGTRLEGIVGIKDCTIRNCRFRLVSVIGTKETAEMLHIERFIVGPRQAGAARNQGSPPTAPNSQ